MSTNSSAAEINFVRQGFKWSTYSSNSAVRGEYGVLSLFLTNSPAS